MVPGRREGVRAGWCPVILDADDLALLRVVAGGGFRWHQPERGTPQLEFLGSPVDCSTNKRITDLILRNYVRIGTSYAFPLFDDEWGFESVEPTVEGRNAIV